MFPDYGTEFELMQVMQQLGTCGISEALPAMNHNHVNAITIHMTG